MFIEEETSGNILRYRFDEVSKIDDFALRILKQGEIPGVFIPGISETEEGIYLLVPVSNSVPLDVYLKSERANEGNITVADALKSVADIVRQAIHMDRACAGYMLGDSVLVKRLRYAYVTDGKLQLVCIPSCEARYESDTERDFYRSIISAAIYTGDEAHEVVSLLNFINDDEFRVDDLLLRLEAILTPRNESETCAVQSYDEQTEVDEVSKTEKQGFVNRLRRFFFPGRDDREEQESYKENLAPSGIHVLAVRSTGDEYPLCFGPDIIGTDENTCSICFPCSGLLDRNHCKIYFERNRFYVEDMGSKEGTYLNNVRLDAGKPKALSPADLICAGEEQFVFSKRAPI